MTRRGGVALIACVAVAVSSIAAAQRGGRGGGRLAGYRLVDPAAFTGEFLFCRISFRQNPFGDGAGWSVDYPRADLNLTFRLGELTKVITTRDIAGQFNHVVIRLTDPELYHCPFIMMTEPGGLFIDESEAAALRDYLLKGGFLWADDFWGERAWNAFAEQIAKALPPGQYPFVDVPLGHELFHALYDVREIPQIPSIGFWLGTGRTSERGYDSATPHVRAIFDEHQHIMIVATHNTDFGDAFERETDNREYFVTFAPPGYAFGVNAIVYGLTH